MPCRQTRQSYPQIRSLLMTIDTGCVAHCISRFLISFDTLLWVFSPHNNNVAHRISYLLATQLCAPGIAAARENFAHKWPFVLYMREKYKVANYVYEFTIKLIKTFLGGRREKQRDREAWDGFRWFGLAARCLEGGFGELSYDSIFVGDE